MNRQEAINKLGEYAVNQRTGKELSSRIEKLARFIERHGNTVTVEVNNSWSVPPKPSTVKASMLIGGTTYQYQVWAVVR